MYSDVGPKIPTSGPVSGTDDRASAGKSEPQRQTPTLADVQSVTLVIWKKHEFNNQLKDEEGPNIYNNIQNKFIQA